MRNIMDSFENFKKRCPKIEFSSCSKQSRPLEPLTCTINKNFKILLSQFRRVELASRRRALARDLYWRLSVLRDSSRAYISALRITMLARRPLLICDWMFCVSWKCVIYLFTRVAVLNCSPEATRASVHYRWIWFFFNHFVVFSMHLHWSPLYVWWITKARACVHTA